MECGEFGVNVTRGCRYEGSVFLGEIICLFFDCDNTGKFSCFSPLSSFFEHCVMQCARKCLVRWDQPWSSPGKNANETQSLTPNLVRVSGIGRTNQFTLLSIEIQGRCEIIHVTRKKVSTEGKIQVEERKEEEHNPKGSTHYILNHKKISPLIRGEIQTRRGENPRLWGQKEVHEYRSGRSTTMWKTIKKCRLHRQHQSNININDRPRWGQLVAWESNWGGKGGGWRYGIDMGKDRGGRTMGSQHRRGRMGQTYVNTHWV